MDSANAGENGVDDKVKEKTKATAIGDFGSIEEFTKKALADIVEATKRANAFPQGTSRDLYCAYPSFGRVIDQHSDRILSLISHVLKRENVKGNIQRRQPDEQFEMLLECNDTIFERLQTNLDELAGIKKAPQTVVETSVSSKASHGAASWNLKNNEVSPSLSARLITSKNIARPQVKFQIPVNNSAATPFTPVLKEKPNSLKPLAILPEYDDAGNIVSYLHPYEYELLKFEVPTSLLKHREPVKPKDVDFTTLMFVDTKAKLLQALYELRKASELAVDVEHHSYRTFLGLTCLVQISTRTKDYIFDTLELRDEMYVLNEVLTDPKIVKIFHGAEFDIEWLQRDLSLYVVNMFDTHQAAKALNFARLSLSYLLKHYCDKDIDKMFQLADWRTRPLPAELIAYARNDTHFLIYVYDRITNDLLEAGNQKPQLLRSIYQRSTEICKKRFQKPLITADSHLDIYRKSKRTFDSRQLFALQEIFKWRDTMARQEDESYGYVLPNHMMLQISESLPREMQGILACCNPIPPLVRQNLHTLHQIVLKAREQPLVKPIFEAETVNRVMAQTKVTDYESKLHCPHDLTAAEDFRDDLPTLIKFDKSKVSTNPNMTLADFSVQLQKPVLRFFDIPDNSEENKKAQLLRRSERNKILGPYKRYLAILPIAEKEKREEAARIEAANSKRQLCPDAPVIMPVSKDENQTPNNIKQEDGNDDDDIYSMPIKAMLKRKYNESVSNKEAGKTEMQFGSPSSKRLRQDNSDPTVDSQINDQFQVKNVHPTKKEQKQKHHNILKRKAETSAAALQRSTIDEENSNDDGGPPEEKPFATQATPSNGEQHETSGPKKIFKNKNKKRKLPSSKSYQSSDRPVQNNFDYKQVDFRKFQGGAQKAKGLELKTQLHAKSNTSKAQNKKFNKLFTFSNVKNNKK